MKEKQGVIKAKGLENRMRNGIEIPEDRNRDGYDCFISFLDIMGFKDLVWRNKHCEVYDLMNAIREILNTVNKTELAKLLKFPEDSGYDFEQVKKISTALFSDSIVLISHSNTKEDLLILIMYTSFILIEGMMLKKIPLKGAIAHGRVTADFENSIFFGIPLIDAYELSKEPYFYGAVLHHSIQEYCNKISLSLDRWFVKYKKVPVKSGGMTKYYYLDLSLYVDRLNKEVVDNLYLNVSGLPRKYVDNTRSVYFPDNDPKKEE